MIIISIFYQKLYKESTHILLLNLAISDLLVCILVIPLTVVTGFAGEFIYGESDYARCQMCQATGPIYIVLTVFAVKVLGLLSIDRFIFIKFPLRYETVVTPLRTIAAVVVAWLISIIEAILPLFGFGEIKYGYTLATCTVYLAEDSIWYGMFLIAVAFVSTIAIIVCNVWVLCIVRKQIRKVYRTRRSFGDKEELRRYNLGLRKEIRRTRNRKQRVLIRAFGAILIGNFISWTPTYVQIPLLLSVDANVVPIGYFSFVWLTFVMHSILHPLIEGCFIPEIQRTFVAAFKLLLCKCLRKRRQDEMELTSMTETSAQEEKESNCCAVCGYAVGGSDSLDDK